MNNECRFADEICKIFNEACDLFSEPSLVFDERLDHAFIKELIINDGYEKWLFETLKQLLHINQYKTPFVKKYKDYELVNVATPNKEFSHIKNTFEKYFKVELYSQLYTPSIIFPFSLYSIYRQQKVIDDSNKIVDLNINKFLSSPSLNMSKYIKNDIFNYLYFLKEISNDVPAVNISINLYMINYYYLFCDLIQLASYVTKDKEPPFLLNEAGIPTNRFVFRAQDNLDFYLKSFMKMNSMLGLQEYLIQEFSNIIFLCSIEDSTHMDEIAKMFGLSLTKPPKEWEVSKRKNDLEELSNKLGGVFNSILEYYELGAVYNLDTFKFLISMDKDPYAQLLDILIEKIEWMGFSQTFAEETLFEKSVSDDGTHIYLSFDDIKDDIVSAINTLAESRVKQIYEDLRPKTKRPNREKKKDK